MKFNLVKASNWRFKGDGIDKKFNPRVVGNNEKCFIDINSVKDLVEFIKLYGEIIVDEDQIIIYDDYIE